MMKLNGKALLIAALLCSAIGFASCTAETPKNTATNDGVSSPKQPTGNTAKTETASTGEKTGVPECDEYVEKYEICLTSIAEKYPQVAPNLKTAFEAQRKGFKDAASTPQGKTALAGQCKQFIESAKQSTSAYACKW
ncbi:MAG: hypothetical protein ABWZ66_00435 [Pyrinomonadaceae bacterium]